ncbi:hypothetical protein H5410_035843 [Solanum commersonii]|uniref:Uncharacterized protein n=1 Tax=Solanum commersonii TaxID=4109 RepID=A0A9J5Y1V3_SOLCO|nr:hypothetical protein H5410_035843 [Solanum commersonii]
MSKSPSSFPKEPMSPEIETSNPLEFNTSTLPEIPSPSTPIYGVREIEPHSSTAVPIENLPCSLTFKQPIERKVVSQPGPVSSTLSERLVDGDLLVEKGTESSILAADKEWVVQSLTEMNGDIQPPFSDMECKLLDPVKYGEPLFDHTLNTHTQLYFVQ